MLNLNSFDIIKVTENDDEVIITMSGDRQQHQKLVYLMENNGYEETEEYISPDGIYSEIFEADHYFELC